ncbi:MAG: lysylphosphatidylglycerol synthase domain-containing protein [Candidatus Omnitrophota bacterium]
MSFLIIVVLIPARAILNALSFYILSQRKIVFKDAFKVTCIATALNKFLFTGTGYLASSYIWRNKEISPYKAMGNFLIIEVLNVSIWLILGLYFGLRLTARFPWVVVIFTVFFLTAVWLKRKALSIRMKPAFESFIKTGIRVLYILPLAALNTACFVAYYFFLFKIFNYYPSIADIVKIIAVSFTVGYLSPAPAGIGFKETGLVAILLEGGLLLKTAAAIALADRVIVTLFWGVLGLCAGFDTIKEQAALRFKKKRE